MLRLSVNDIEVGTRQRKVFATGPLDELKQSIQVNGLLHPIVVVRSGEKWRLVAGERRLRAIKEIKQPYNCNREPYNPGEVPCTILEASDEIKIREAELTENMQRVDLAWQERVAALDELHSLRVAQNPSHSPTDTAKEIAPAAGITVSAARERVHRATLIADHMDNPNVARAKDETSAYKIITAEIERELKAELAKRNIGKSAASKRHTLIRGICEEVMESGEIGGGFPLIIADPPYGMGAHAFGDAATLAHTYDDSPEAAKFIANCIFRSGFKITADQAHIYMFCDIEHFLALREMGAAAGWNMWRTPLVWHKTGAAAHAPDHEYGFRRDHEIMVFGAKGRKPFSQVFSDVFEFAQVQQKTHAAQKPVELYKTLIGRSCLPGTRVLDPCCGSGVIFEAAELCGVRAVGIEANEQHYNSSLVRIAALDADGGKVDGQ